MQLQLKRKSGNKSRGFRYTDASLQHFSMMSWIIGGRRWYEMFRANFEGMVPAPRTIERMVANFEIPIIEDALNITQLKEYLFRNHFPPIIAISEDATALVKKIEYSNGTNRAIGFSLPLRCNGLPDAEDSVTNTALDIFRLFNTLETATVAIVVMAQPLAPDAAPIRLCAFGSNNKFTANDVRNRLKTKRDWKQRAFRF